MIGTILNVITVAVGSTLGLLIGDRLPKERQNSVVTGLGWVTLVVGIDNALLSGNIIIPLISVIVGVLIGDWIDIQAKLDHFAAWLQSKAATDKDDDAARERFINGFVTASLVFCVGPLTVIGSLRDGMAGDYELLAIKSTLDFFAALAFAASLGIGVMFSIITIIIVQGGLALVGFFSGEVMSSAMVDEMTATGGLILIGLSLILLDLKHSRVANYLPALVIAPLIVVIATGLGIDIYPDF